MKQYDSYIIYGSHFPESIYKMITKNTSLSFFNYKIEQQFQCKIYEFDVPISENNNQKRYFLAIILEQSDSSILMIDNFCKIDKTNYYKMLETFDIDKKEPYLISVPIVRLLVNNE
jgi:hypothetical protein